MNTLCGSWVEQVVVIIILGPGNAFVKIVWELRQHIVDTVCQLGQHIVNIVWELGNYIVNTVWELGQQIAQL